MSPEQIYHNINDHFAVYWSLMVPISKVKTPNPHGWPVLHDATHITIIYGMTVQALFCSKP